MVRKKISSKINLNYWILAGVILMVVVGGFFYYLDSQSVNCSDEMCFLARAQKCKPVYFENRITTATVAYTVMNGCVVEKKIIGLDPSEPDAAHQLFENVGMKCTYSKGSFNPDLLRTLTAELANCQGPLKDVFSLA